MYYSKVLFKGLLILTTTSFIFHLPISALDISDLKIAPLDEAPWKSMQKGQLITYDAVINVLKKIESDDWGKIISTAKEVLKSFNTHR